MPTKTLGWLLLMLFVSACMTQQMETLVPTQTLIPSTETPTATPIVPTNTPQALSEPQDFILTPSATPLLPMIETTAIFDAGIVQQTRIDLANNLGLSIDQLQLVDVRPRIYMVDACPTARFPIPPDFSHGVEVTWFVDTQTHTYLTWDNQDFVWCTVDSVRGRYLAAVDPIAAELSALAIRRVSQQQNIASDDVRLVDMVPVQWQDSSLGCPRTGQQYADTRIDGYRIMIEAGGISYTFHTDSVQLILCDESAN